MTEFIAVENHGPLIIATNYWESTLESAGLIYVSPHAGAFRILMPRVKEPEIKEMTTGKEVVISRGPCPKMGRPDAFELLFEDGTESPFALFLTPESFQTVPAPQDADKEWICTVWTAPRRDKPPHKALERPAFYRIVPKIPWLKPRK